MPTPTRYLTNKQYTLAGGLAASTSGAKETILIGLTEGDGRSTIGCYKVVLWKAEVNGVPQVPEDDNEKEYMFVVSHPTGDKLEVLRGMEGSSAGAHPFDPDIVYKIAVVLTSTDYDGARPYLTPMDFGAKADGTTDDTQAATDADAAAATAGMEVFWPQGTYLINGNVTVSTSHRGAGVGKTVLKSGASTTSGVLSLDGTDGVEISDFSFDIDHGVAAVYGAPAASAIAERCKIERLHVDANHAAARAINLQAPSASQWRHTTIRDVVAVNSIATPSFDVDGILVSAGTVAGAIGLLVENCTIVGFGRNLNVSAASAGHWEGVKIVDNRFEYPYSYNVRAYHCGGVSFIGNHLDGRKDNTGTARGECGLWADNGSTHRRFKIVDNEFRYHTELALLTTEWANCVVQANVFEDNQRDILFSGCHNSSLIGNTTRNAAEWSISTDKDFTTTGASTQVYNNEHPALNYSCSIIGNNIQNAGEDGLILAGEDGALVLGNTIVRNGISSANPAASSGFADILIQRSGGGTLTNNAGLRLIANIVGNANQGGSMTAGKSQYGIRQLQGCGFLEILACEFYDLEDAVEAFGCGSGPVSVIDCFFLSCEDMNLATGIGTAIYRDNRFNLGLLASDATYAKDWSGDFEMQGGQSLFMGLPTAAPADVDLENNQAVMWYDSTGPSIKVKHKDGGGVVRNGTVCTLA